MSAGDGTPPLIVHIVHHFDTGGMENGMINLFNALPATRFRHAVICLTHYSAFRERVHAQQVNFYALHKSPGHHFAWVPQLWKLLRRLGPDIVHTRNLSALEAQFVAAAAGVRRTIHGEHGRDVFDLHGVNRRYTWLRRAAQPLVSHYIAVSQDLARWLRETVHVPARKITQIYNGVDCTIFHPAEGPQYGALPDGFADEACVVFGSVGRMAEVKDYPTLTRAFIKLVQDHPQIAMNARLVIVGEGVSRQPCADLLAEAGLSHLAWLPGERHDIAELLRAMDVFVLPSLNEGISNTLLEAQASGLPVIATQVGGNVELVEDGVNGTLVPPSDVEKMAHALLHYMGTDIGANERIRAHGQLARQRVAEGFSISAMASAYAEVYERVLARRRN